MQDRTQGNLDVEKEVLDSIVHIANRCFDGHFTLMKFTTNWRLSFGEQPFRENIPDSSVIINRMPVGDTLEIAYLNAIGSLTINIQQCFSSTCPSARFGICNDSEVVLSGGTCKNIVKQRPARLYSATISAGIK